MSFSLVLVRCTSFSSVCECVFGLTQLHSFDYFSSNCIAIRLNKILKNALMVDTIPVWTS